MKKNKFLIGIGITVFGLVISWGIWITNGTFKSNTVQEVTKATISVLCVDMGKIQGDVKEIRSELKEQRDLIYQNQEKILERLGGISKLVKQRNRDD